MPPKRRAAAARAKPAPAAPPNVVHDEAAIETAIKESEEAAAALEAARRASEAASRHLDMLRARASAASLDKVSHDVWRSEIFPRLSALDTINAAAVSRAWAEDVASGVKGRGEIVVSSHNLRPPEREHPLRSSTNPELIQWEKDLLALQAKLVPRQPPPQQQRKPHPESWKLHRKVMEVEEQDADIRMAKSDLLPRADLIERCRANAGSLRRLRLRFTGEEDAVSRPELEAVSSLVSALPLLSTIEISTLMEHWRPWTRLLLPCLLRAVAEGVAASPLASERGGGGGSHVLALALRGYLRTKYEPEDIRANEQKQRELPRGWAEGLGLVPSAAGATTTTATATATASTPAWPRPYEEMDDIALASSAIALLAKHSPIEKLALELSFWDADDPPPQRPSAAEAAARRAAPRTLGALLQPLANQLVDLSVDSEQWRRATRGGFAREGASAPPAPSLSSVVAAENSRPPPGLGPLPRLRVLRLVDPDTSSAAFLLSRASFEGMVRPSTLHFIKSWRRPNPFVIAPEDDADHFNDMRFYSPTDEMARLARLPQAPLDRALEPLADCVTELLIDVSEVPWVGQTFSYSFGSLRSLRRLAVRLALPSTSSKILRVLNLSAFSRAHGGGPRIFSHFFTGFLDLASLFEKKAPYPKLKLLFLENCDLVMSEVRSLAAFRNAGAAASASSSSGGVAGPAELAARFLDGSGAMVRIHLHGCRFQGASEGVFVSAAAEVLRPSGTALTTDAARAAAFMRALASSSSSSSSPSDGSGGGGGGSGKKRASQKKGGDGALQPPPQPPAFKGICFGCTAFGEWNEFVDTMEFSKKVDWRDTDYYS